jgi:hypothetical protein
MGQATTLPPRQQPLVVVAGRYTTAVVLPKPGMASPKPKGPLWECPTTSILYLEPMAPSPLRPSPPKHAPTSPACHPWPRRHLHRLTTSNRQTSPPEPPLQPEKLIGAAPTTLTSTPGAIATALINRPPDEVVGATSRHLPHPQPPPPLST